MKNKEIFDKKPILGFWDFKAIMDKTRIESGRTMVEMLGVLAVIGILSVVGMIGYRYAKNKYGAFN